MSLGKAAREPVEATVRAGGAKAILDALQELGGVPSEVLAAVGINPGLFDDPDNLITYRARDRLMQQCVMQTGCDHFGLLVGQRMNLQSLGAIGLLARHSADVHSSLRVLESLLHLHSRGAVLKLDVDDRLATLTYDAFQPGVDATDQTGDAAVAMMTNVMRSLCGVAFRPEAAGFAHRRPANVGPFTRFFGCRLNFDAEHYALSFDARWLDVRPEGVDDELRRLLLKQVKALTSDRDDDFPGQLRSLLRTAILTGDVHIDQVAAIFSISSRTLRRRLDAHGNSFQQLLDESRLETARQMLATTSLNVTQIAATVGYGGASAFTRAFRRWQGTTPSEWRARRES